VRPGPPPGLEKRILKELRDLDMNRVRFSIEIAPRDRGQTECDRVRFLMSANAGEDLRPIAKIASGGELARIMLALKNVLAEQDFVGTLVFDEVDTGVSGRAAQKVAEKLAQVSRSKQVLCVTHLPQLAAMADTHFPWRRASGRPHLYQRHAMDTLAAQGGAGPTYRRQPRDGCAVAKAQGELLDEAEA
jgi:DNA repair protein RecN (Recombination protein N)